MFERKYGVATANGTHIVIPIVKAGEVNFAVSGDWTPAAGDVKITKDDGAPANIATLPTYVANQGWEFQFSAAELTAGKIDMLIVDQTATKVIEDQFFSIKTLALVPDLSGYEDGFVYCNSVIGSAGTVLGINGTFDNPVASLSDAKTLADQIGQSVRVGGVHVNRTENFGGYRLEGYQRDADIDGDSTTHLGLNDCKITNIRITGGVGCNDGTQFYGCRIENIDAGTGTEGLEGHAYDCYFSGSLGLNEGGGFFVENGRGAFDGGDPQFDFVLASASIMRVNIYGWHGDLKVNNMNDGSHHFRLFADGGANLEIESGNTDGDIELQNVGVITNNTGGATVTVLDGVKAYPDGYVYYDAAAGNTKSILGIDGTINNPVSSLSALTAVSDQVGKRVRAKGALALDAATVGYVIEEWDGSLVITGSVSVDISGAIIRGGHFTGLMLADNDTRFYNTILDAVATSGITNGLQGHMFDCEFDGTSSLSRAALAETHIIGGHCRPTNPAFSWTDLNNQHALFISSLTGHIHIADMIHINAICDISVNGGSSFRVAGTVAGGNLTLVGMGLYLKSPGAVLTTEDISDWEQLKIVTHVGSAQAGTATTITLDDTGASAIDDFYSIDYYIQITDATGIGQVRRITAYDGTTKIATVDRAWEVNPDATSRYSVFGLPDSQAAAGGDWTTAEKNQIRHRINIDGNQVAPSVEGGGAGKLAGPNADLTLKSIKVIQTVDNDHAVEYIGNVDGAGMKVQGGIGGHGTHSAGGASVGHGIFAEASGGTGTGENANALHLEKNTSSVGSALRAIVTGATGPAIKATAAGANAGFLSQGGDVSGSGIKAEAIGLNSHGLETVRTGTGIDLKASVHGDGSWEGISQFKKNVAFANFPIYMVLSSNHITPGVGLNVTGQISKDGGAFAALTNAVVEVGSGFYKVNLTAAEMNADSITLKFIAATADNRLVSFPTNV